MTLHYSDDRVTVYHGDCIEVMRQLPDNSVDAVVTDPPYLIGFMGRNWDSADGIAGKPEVWREALRVLKPGGHLLAFGGTRTWHRLAVAIEDAGFEIRDSIAYQHSTTVFCQCSAVQYDHETISRQGVPSVRPDVAANDSLSGDSQQDVREGVRGSCGQCSKEGQADGTHAGGVSCLHGMRQDYREALGMAEAGQESDVQPTMQRGSSRARLGETRVQGSSGLDAAVRGQSARTDDRRHQPRVAGRGDLLAQGGQLPSDQIRPSAEVGVANGAQGRIYYGAQTANGNDVRAFTDAPGSGESHQSERAGQFTDEPGVVPNERGSQTWRGWPICGRCGKPLEPPFHSGPLSWQYASGFPKSLDVSKAIDKNNGEVGRLLKFTAWMRTTGLTASDLNKATGTFMGSHYLTNKSQPAIPTPELWQIIRPLCGDVPAWVDELVQRIAAEREVVGERKQRANSDKSAVPMNASAGVVELITAPATRAAQKWAGFGTALKPAHEPIVVARKPLIGTVAENILTHGTGALNIDGCRIGTTDVIPNTTNNNIKGAAYGSDTEGRERDTTYKQNTAGRWPANVILDESQAAELDKQSGVTSSTPFRRKDGPATFGGAFGNGSEVVSDAMYADTGGASRFFYVAKANKKERPNVNGVAHPTVKPMALMQYLVRLVTPPGGTVLEPFAGSGTTIEAALNEGFNVIGIEMTDEYLPLIMSRIERYGDKLC